MAAEQDFPEQVFTEHRGTLIAVAYRVLGSVTDAEDVVQDAWLRWAGVDHASVTDPKAYLITITTRLAIDKLRRLSTRRETYVGAWLPEPISTGPDVAERAELADSIELALLVILETLSPLERAVFVLREAFGLPYAEIGEILGREEAATRQLALRAREHVQERRPRYDVDRAQRRALTERFVAACATGDVDALTALFADDVRLVSDGGGKAKAPLRTITGADKVSRFIAAISTEEGAQAFMTSIGEPPATNFDVAIADVNAAPAAIISAGGRPILVISVHVAQGRIEEVYFMANPEKLSGVSRSAPGATSELVWPDTSPSSAADSQD